MGDTPNHFEVLQLAEGDAALRRSFFDPQQVAMLPVGIENDGSRILVIRINDLTSLLALLPSGLILDRGTKHHARPLSQYLPARGGLLAVRANYSNTGQAMRGLRSLIDATARFKTRASCFVGVKDPVFDALAQKAGPVVQTKHPQPDATGHLGVLLDERITVPDSLKRKYLGASPQVDWVRRSIVLAARVDHPVLIQGETGTGKEVVARQIHNLSRRGAETFIPVNCGGISPELFESELFGHVRGAFTGATSEKKGLWTVADKGTIFLDEIGDMPMHHQVKVLRALEDGTFIPVGAEKEICSRARVIAATNRDLAGMVLNGRFREDLYYRLFTFRIITPALCEHRGDIPLLVRHFWADIGDGSAPALTQSVTEALAQYQWPGNARELRSFLINLLLYANGRKVDVPLVHAVMRERLGTALVKGKDS